MAAAVAANDDGRDPSLMTTLLELQHLCQQLGWASVGDKTDAVLGLLMDASLSELGRLEPAARSAGRG